MLSNKIRAGIPFDDLRAKSIFVRDFESANRAQILCQLSDDDADDDGDEAEGPRTRIDLGCNIRFNGDEACIWRLKG